MKPKHKGMAAFCILGSVIGFTLGNAAQSSSVVIVTRVHIKTKIIVHEMDAKDFTKKLVSAQSFKCLNYIWTKESHWNPHAKELSTHASGIGQLEPQTWKLLNYIPTTNSNAQIVASLVYIYEHYGNKGICVAAQHSKVWGWY